MKFFFPLFSFIAFFTLSLSAKASIVSQQEYAVPSFEKSGFPQNSEFKDYYENTIRPLYTLKAKTSLFTDMTYMSDGLKIRGFIIAPRTISSKTKLPILVFNHGGNRDYGKLTIKDLLWLNKFAEKGYLVVASQYRGVDGSEGNDEFGGHDVNDVRNITRIAKTLAHADSKHVYILGHSRGGMMTYLSLKNSHEYAAAAVLAGECDLKKGLEIWPDFEKDVYAEIIPNYATQKEKQLTLRSACSWPEKITTPVYILQGDQDKKVEPIQAQMIAQRLRAKGRTARLEMIPGGDHIFFFKKSNSDEIVSKIDQWFRQH